MALFDTIEKGLIKMTASERNAVDDLIRQSSRSRTLDDNKYVARILAPPIRKIASYQSWAEQFFVPVTVALGEDKLLPVDDYVAVIWNTSDDGAAKYVRPSFKFKRLETQHIDSGIELHWDQLEMAGWNQLAKMVSDVAEEIARKHDELAAVVLDAAALSVATHFPTVASTMTKAAVDDVFEGAAGIGFPIQKVAVNSATVLAMRGWGTGTFTYPSDSKAAALDSQGYIGDYGGAQWFTSPWVPADHVYFVASPDRLGYYLREGQMRYSTGQDMDLKIDKYTWDERIGYHVENAYSVWRLTIT